MHIVELWQAVEQQISQFPGAPLGRYLDPISESRLVEAEQNFGCRLPDEIRQLYLWRNGMLENKSLGLLRPGVLCSPYCWQPIEECLEVWRSNCKFDARSDRISEDDEDARRGLIRLDRFFRPGWIPIARRGRSFLYIDLDPGNEGVLGQMIEIEIEPLYVAPSISIYLRQLSYAISTGRLIANEMCWTNPAGSYVGFNLMKLCADMPADWMPPSVGA